MDTQWRRLWQEAGIPLNLIDRAAQHHARWGGLSLPAVRDLPEDAAGPGVLQVLSPEQVSGLPDPGWAFEAGPQRTAVPYSFLVSSDGTFGISGGADGRWVPLHGSVDGWVDSVALAHAALENAESVTRLTGAEVDKLDMNSMDPVESIQGISNNWWHRPGLLLAVYAGESIYFDIPDYRTAFLYVCDIDIQGV